MMDDKQGKMGMGYGRFAAMIATSTVVMYGLMYLNTYAMSHIEYSQTRMWMACVMGATMALIMLGFMWGMYNNRGVNVGIIAGSIVVFALTLWLVRSQETVDDVSYMRAMIPHHSIAIMTSERAHIKDPEVRKLADGIIDAQVREIAQMKRMIARLESHPTPSGAPDLPSYRDKGATPPAPETDESTGINTLAPIH
jgi:Na+/proline symporter